MARRVLTATVVALALALAPAVAAADSGGQLTITPAFALTKRPLHPARHHGKRHRRTHHRSMSRRSDRRTRDRKHVLPNTGFDLPAVLLAAASVAATGALLRIRSRPRRRVRA